MFTRLVANEELLRFELGMLCISLHVVKLARLMAVVILWTPLFTLFVLRAMYCYFTYLCVLGTTLHCVVMDVMPVGEGLTPVHLS